MNPLARITDTAKAYIAGGLLAVILALVIALLLTRATNARHRAELDTCNTKQEVNLASIETLKAAVQDQNRRITALADAGRTKQDAAAKAENLAAERERAAQGQIDALRRSAALRRPENGPCVISTDLAATKGL